VTTGPHPACRPARKEGRMDLLWIIIIVLVVLALLGYFGFGRRRGL
jgi:flagellar basal body-associated protein FliL